MPNYYKFLDEFFNEQMNGNLSTSVFSDYENDLKEAKGLYNLLYTHKDLFKFISEHNSSLTDKDKINIIHTTYIPNTSDFDDVELSELNSEHLNGNYQINMEFEQNKSKPTLFILQQGILTLVSDYRDQTYYSLRAFKDITNNLRNIFMILSKIYPEKITREILTSITNLNNDSFSQSLKTYYQREKLKLVIGDNLTIDYKKELEKARYDLTDHIAELRSTEEEIQKLKNRLLLLQNNFEIKSKNVNRLYKQSKEKQETTVDTSVVNNLHNELYSHPLTGRVTIDASSTRGLFNVAILTKPIPAENWNQDPYNLALSQEGRISAELYREVYNRTGKIQGYYSPYYIRFYFKVHENGNRTISNINLVPVNYDFQNPHEKHNCMGRYRSYLDDAREEGDILRLISILMEYLKTTTIGDVAGDLFLQHMYLKLESEEEFKWYRSKLERERIYQLLKNQDSN